MAEIDTVRDCDKRNLPPKFCHHKNHKICHQNLIILILECSDKGRPAKEIYKPKKRISELGLEAQFSNLSTQECFIN